MQAQLLIIKRHNAMEGVADTEQYLIINSKSIIAFISFKIDYVKTKLKNRGYERPIVL
jgi:hypothetical protein